MSNVSLYPEEWSVGGRWQGGPGPASAVSGSVEWSARPGWHWDTASAESQQPPGPSGHRPVPRDQLQVPESPDQAQGQSQGAGLPPEGHPGQRQCEQRVWDQGALHRPGQYWVRNCDSSQCPANIASQQPFPGTAR